MKSVVIAGRLGKAAELRRTQGGDPVLGFSVAVDDGWGENKRTLWFKCSLWGKRGESLAEHLGKGAAVTVSGDLSTDEYDGKTGLTVRVAELTLQGGASERSEPAKSKSSRSEQGMYDREPRGGATPGFNRDLDDETEIPF